jgi:hypothetical protein
MSYFDKSQKVWKKEWKKVGKVTSYRVIKSQLD